mmetsp:Transcript_32305/g.53424  ORF Transcript_32305/g.53424 Transcript_32305/m.53424 type:complete len:417 (+) Transcript_32305:25-1275(+)|eukprot:CAMPEP_0119337442 /NCGR_PEP_ID=MMETSP1333-20130426/94004_1 /TAXON_ID=418940 /ORGANISM="Scyphosphaera apsteinii, Strain RCC1455" /LENGTH=416 /DNA_ID=CAMNT_0007348489 /DNA_START=15 /DNA_END=1265 /DNA_ORIENTATION=-
MMRSALLFVVGTAAAWRPQSTFSRVLQFLTADLVPPLPSLAELIQGSHPRAVLDIGCGTGLALLQVAAMIEEIGSSQRWLRNRSVCAVGTSALNYTTFIFEAHHQATPSLSQGRAQGLGALLEEGDLHSATRAELSRTFRVKMPLAVPRIVNVEWTDDYQGLPFRDRAFDLVLSQRAMKFTSPASALPRFATELLRTMAGGGHAIMQLATSDGNALRPFGYQWRSSAMFGDRTAPLLKRSPARLNTAETYWMAQRRNSSSSIPLELVTGLAPTFGSSFDCGESCHPHCSHKSTHQPSRHNKAERCVLAYLSGTQKTLNLFIHVLDIPGTHCLAAAAGLPPLSAAWWSSARAETPIDRDAIMQALKKRQADGLRHSAKHVSDVERETLHVESYVTGVRLWFRTFLQLYYYVPQGLED